MKKKCKKCGEEKEIDAFSRAATTKDNRRSWCKKCTAKRTKERKDDKKSYFGINMLL